MGLSPGQPKVLRYLSELGRSSQRELADCCDVDPSAICRMLDSLERGGFVTRSPSPNDRRSGQVELTPQGRDALDAWEGRCKVIEEQMLQGFSPEERAQLRDFLERTYRNVGGHFLEEETP
ncbi:MAG: MarR family transcriptional regulator [Oscillospiraceae bacterium]|nr:MarR family transcriptional regulator [Oscillospiraceae bacterium]